eukprot:jgi/Mesvir1/10204/Mv08524-RA.1
MAAFLPVPLVLPRDASPRETRDVLRSVEGVCRYHDLPRPFIKVVNKTKDLVAELGNDDYVVTELRKGEYCLLALVRVRGGRTVCAIVHGDRNVSIVRMPPFKTKLFKGTVAAGVLGRDPLGRSVFYVHDCLAFARHSLLHRPFLDRMEYARQLADMNFPSVGSYYIHTFIKCLSFLESNADHRGMESHNMLFLPRGAPSHMSYVAGGVPILLENKSGDVEDRGFLTRPSRPSGFSLFSLSPPSWGRTIPNVRATPDPVDARLPFALLEHVADGDPAERLLDGRVQPSVSRQRVAVVRRRVGRADLGYAVPSFPRTRELDELGVVVRRGHEFHGFLDDLVVRADGRQEQLLQRSALAALLRDVAVPVELAQVRVRSLLVDLAVVAAAAAAAEEGDSPAMKESEEADPVAMVVVKLPEEMTNEELAKERARLLALNNGNENAEAVKRIQAYIEAREIEQSAFPTAADIAGRTGTVRRGWRRPARRPDVPREGVSRDLAVLARHVRVASERARRQSHQRPAAGVRGEDAQRRGDASARRPRRPDERHVEAYTIKSFTTSPSSPPRGSTCMYPSSCTASRNGVRG